MTSNYISQSVLARTRLERYNTPGVRFVGIALFLVFLVLYVLQTSTLATRTFVINDLQKELRVLERETDSLDVQIAEERALARIEERLTNETFTPVDHIAYLSPVGTTVASNQ